MTQRLALGITVGASNSVAVAATEEGDDGLGPSGGGYLRSHPSVLRLSEDMAPTLGAGARSTGRHSSDILLEGFLARVGDPVGILAEDGSSYSAPDLVATAIGCLVDEIAAETGRSGAQATVACHPAWWSRHTVDIQRDALERAGLGEVTLVPEPTAAIRWLDAAHGWADDGAVIVFDLGATGSTVSVVRTGEHASLLGTPLRNTDVAGAEFDLLTMRYVLANAVLAADFDPFDPVVERELSALRERCRKAKEELSINTATVVPVRLDPADPHGTVRLVRGELEDLLRGPLSSAMDLIRDAVHRAGLDIGDVGRVLLTGGGGAIPLVAELVSTEFGLPVVAAPDPEHTTARGAALLAADLLAAETDQLPLVDPVAEDETVPQPRALPSAGLAALPEERPARRRALTSRQRLAVVAGTAAAIGLLATGTLAIGTGIQSGPSTPASTEQSSTGAAQVAATPGARTSDPSAPSGVAATDSASSPGRAGAGTSQAGSPTSPAQGTTVAVVNSEQSPDQPAPAPAADAPAPQPAPQPQSQQPSPAPAPAPAPAPTNPSPPTQQQPRPTQPTAPSLPTGVLGDTLGTVLRAPGEILGGSGG
ncbi:Hsp70 family protein [Nocardia sp. NPDC047648]|uniref:Hsp70 family protein n=1 Tax=Nocardia sp. NPDC047648 TaxID=3155625 RepID=UPI0033F375C3